MAWVAAATIGGSLISGSMQADAAENAANTQAAATGQSIAEQRRQFDISQAMQQRQYDQARSDNAPFLGTGTAANTRLAQLLGLNVPAQSAAASTSAPSGRGWNDLYTEALSRAPFQQDQNGDGLYVNGRRAYSLGGPDMYTPPDSLRDTGWAKSEADRMYAQQQAPAPQAAPSAAPMAPAGPGQFGGGDLTRRFTSDDLSADPVYQNGLKFGLDRGTEGINARATAGGMYDSGQTLKALTQFGNDYGSTKANESYNRFTNDQNSVYNKLAGVSGTGQVATGQVGTAGTNMVNSVTAAGTNMANNVGSSLEGAGNARAAGIVGGANAWGNAASGLSGAMNNYQNNQILQKLLARGSGGMGGSTWNGFTET